MTNNILNQLKLAIPELPPSEMKIGEYVVENPQEILYMNISELAEKSNSSAAAVVRFCKSVGIENFGNLKIKLSAQNIQNIEVDFDVKENEPTSFIVEKTLSNTMQVFQDTAQLINDEMINRVVNMIEKSDMIYVYGVGASFLIAEDIAQKWRRIGKKVYSTSDYHLLLTTMAAQNENAILWGISYSGATKEVLLLNEKAKEFGMQTIGLTRIGQNKLSQNVDALLTTARAPEAVLRSAATTSRFAQLFVIDVVFLSYTSKSYESTKHQLEISRKVISDLT